jgi:hypothetical protein
MNDDEVFDLGNLSEEPNVSLNAKRWVQGWARRRFHPARSRTRPSACRLSALRTASAGPRPARPVLLVARPPART